MNKDTQEVQGEELNIEAGQIELRRWLKERGIEPHKNKEFTIGEVINLFKDFVKQYQKKMK